MDYCVFCSPNKSSVASLSETSRIPPLTMRESKLLCSLDRTLPRLCPPLETSGGLSEVNVMFESGNWFQSYFEFIDALFLCGFIFSLLSFLRLPLFVIADVPCNST